MTWNDEEPGRMRQHVAVVRADRVLQRHTHEALIAHAHAHGLRGSKDKAELAWRLTVNGLVDRFGSLRGGWPE